MRRVGLTVGILVKIESRTAALPLTSTLQMASDFGNPMPSRPLTLDAVYFGAVPVSFEAVDGHTLPFVSSEWTEDASSLPTVLSRFNFAPPSSDGDLHPPQSSRVDVAFCSLPTPIVSRWTPFVPTRHPRPRLLAHAWTGLCCSSGGAAARASTAFDQTLRPSRSAARAQ